MVLSIFSGLLPLLLLAGIVAGIIAVARRHEDEDEPGIGTVRRLVLYALAFVAAMLAATGISLLLGGIFDALAGDLIISESETELAIGLSLTLVGGIAWAVLWRVASSTVANHPVERRSIARHLYFGTVRGVALIVVMVAATQLLQWALGVGDFEGNAVGFALVWALVWFAHQRLLTLDGPPSPVAHSLGRIYTFGAAFVGLAVLAGATTMLLSEYLGEAYDATYGRTLAGDPDAPLSRAAREYLAVAIVGLAAWLWHWTQARRDSASTVWRVYVFLGGLLGGMTMTLVAASVMLHSILQWYFGRPSATSAFAHFQSLPDAFSALAVGLLLWGYHRAVLAERTREAAASPSETERVYRYLAAAAGLVTLVIGFARIIATASDLLAREEAFFGGAEYWQNQLVLGVTLLAVGGPIWVRYWFDVEAHVTRNGVSERIALSRRVFLYGVFGAAGVTALISLSVVLFEVFQGLLEGTLSMTVFRDARWSIAFLVVAATASAYYWQILRADQRAQPAEAARSRRFLEVTVINGNDGGALARRIEGKLGTRVRAWHRPDIAPVAPTEFDLDALVVQIEASPADRVLVVIAPGGGGAVIPYSAG
jgi:Domain of unknown function (DUF5671)